MVAGYLDWKMTFFYFLMKKNYMFVNKMIT